MYTGKFFSKAIGILLLMLLIGFSVSAQNYRVNGDAIQISPTCFRLTDTVAYQAGSVYNSTPINLKQPFDFTFYTYFGDEDVNGADGIAFLLQNSPKKDSALGGPGIGMGYTNGPVISPSLAVEFDTYDNTSTGFPDMADDHIAIIKDGDLTTNLKGPTQASFFSGNIENDACHSIRITWDPFNFRLQVYFDGFQRFFTPYTNDLITNYFAGDSMVYYGFASSTGYANNIQVVCLGNYAYASTPQTLCGSQQVLLTAGGGLSYSWSPAASCVTPLDDSTFTTPTKTTKYVVTVTNEIGCKDTASTYVTINPVSMAGTITTVSDTICNGDVAQLTVTGSAGTIQWQSSPDSLTYADISGANSASYTSAALTQDVFYRTFIKGGICGSDSSAGKKISIVTAPIAGSVTSSVDSICEGTALSGVLTSAGSAGTIQWQLSTDSIHFTSIPGETNATYNTPPVLPQTTYYRVMADNRYCSADSSSVVAVHILAAPTADFTISGTPPHVTFTPAVTGGVQFYQWDFGDGTGTSNDAIPTYDYAKVDTYTVCLTVYNASNCSYTICKPVDLLDGVQSPDNKTVFQLYPNPAGSVVYLYVEGNEATYTLSLFNQLGQKVTFPVKSIHNKEAVLLNVAALPPGTYALVLTGSHGRYTTRFVRE